MYKHEVLRNEQEYVSKLSEHERELYLFDDETDARLASFNDYHVNAFLGIGRVLNELHTLHEQYNELLETIYALPNATETQQHFYDMLETANESRLMLTLAIGSQATVVDLSCMDMCDTLYETLATLKMMAFDNLFNYSATAEKL